MDEIEQIHLKTAGELPEAARPTLGLTLTPKLLTLTPFVGLPLTLTRLPLHLPAFICGHQKLSLTEIVPYTLFFLYFIWEFCPGGHRDSPPKTGKKFSFSCEIKPWPNLQSKYLYYSRFSRFLRIKKRHAFCDPKVNKNTWRNYWGNSKRFKNSRRLKSSRI